MLSDGSLRQDEQRRGPKAVPSANHYAATQQTQIAGIRGFFLPEGKAMSVKVKDLQQFLSSLYEVSFPEEGIHYGDAEMEVRGVLACWMANVRAVRRAIDEHCNLIVCHEIPFFGRPTAVRPNDYSEFYHWKANRLRKELLDANRIALIQCHRTLDAFCVAETFESALGLGRPSVVEEMAGYEAVRLFEIQPTRVGSLIERWKETLGLERIRVRAPDLDRRVRLVGLAWGGIGLHTNLPLDARLVELGAELLVGGETDEYTIQFCADSGVDFIELGHSVSETLGMKAAAEHLGARFPELKVCSFEEPPLYRFA